MKIKVSSQKRMARYAGRIMLPLALAAASSAACALSAISDEDLGGVTGEGVAFLPENAVMLFRGAGANETTATLLADRSRDTGYFRFIPVGPLTAASTCTGYPSPTCTHPYGPTTGKADVFLYGLAISRADGDSNSRLSATNPMIASWGTSSNPWLLKVQTQNTQDFSTTDSTAKPVSYLALEAPLYDTTIPATAAAGADAYNLKLAFWADIFNRRPDIAEGGPTQFDVGGAGRQNRLRLQAIWDGLGLNGTDVKLFQTLAGATNTGGMSVSYNNTFGMTGLVRMNSGDSRNLRAAYTDVITPTTGAVSAWNNVHGGWSTTLGTAQAGGNCGNGGATNTAYSNTGSAGCQYMVQNRTRTDSKSRTRTWTPPAANVLRLSTRETSGSAVDLTTPANNGTLAPNFAQDEGLFLYAPNINLPLGSLQQPLTFGVAADGRNLVLEVARIPDKAAAYNAIYTNYGGGLGSAAFTGSTCNVHTCGTSAIAGYQGSNATHGSITIGTTNYNPATNLLTADTSAEAIGVSFGALKSQTLTAGTSVTTTEVQYKQRQLLSETWRSASRCTSSILGNCTGRTDQTGTLSQWQYFTGSAWATGATAVPKPTDVAQCSTAAFNGNSGCSNVSPAVTYDGTTYPACPNNAPCTRYGTASNRDWTYTTDGTWLTASNPTVNTFIGAANGTTGGPNLATAPNQAANPVVGSPMQSSNLGSVVIDGILIQHLKFTTTGL